MFHRPTKSSVATTFQHEISFPNPGNQDAIIFSGVRGGRSFCDDDIDKDEYSSADSYRITQSIALLSCCNYQLRQLRNCFVMHFLNNCLNSWWTAQRQTKQHPQRRRRRTATLLIGASFFTTTTIVFLHQFDAYVREYQGPLDHVASDLLKPYYGKFCPKLSDSDGLGNISSSSYESYNATSWNCAVVNSAEKKKDDVMMPRIFMIGARDEDEDTYDDWMNALNQNYLYTDGNINKSQHVPRLERINTLAMSNQYALSGNIPRNNQTVSPVDVSSNTNQNRKGFLCRKIKWEHRLFAVYQAIFSQLLRRYPIDLGFVIIEDDAVLKNPHAFVEEVCNAHNNQMEFYSLYQSPLQSRGMTRPPSCIYVHGTVAFYIQRPFMEKIVSEQRREWFCRFPIDMYISMMGPWYATTREIVGHLGKGRVGST